jgi:hypothetical protein
MANFSGLFQAEVTRLSKKAVRTETAPLKAQIQKLRAEATATKRALIYLKREVDRLQKELSRENKAKPVAAAEKVSGQHRYSPKMLAAFAERNDLSGPQVAKLLGGTPASAYSWLKGLRPRQRYIDAFHEVKVLSKSEIAERLGKLSICMKADTYSHLGTDTPTHTNATVSRTKPDI